jgi:phage gp36-like protein
VAYATIEDIVDIYGQSTLQNYAPLKPDDSVDEDKVSTALDRASAEVDAYLSGRYNVPLQRPGQQIKQVVVDIAVYRMAVSLTVQTKENRLRYEDAISFLKLAASGTKGIGVGDEDADAEDPGADSRKIRVSYFRRA